jgi:hypothetical protein
MTFRPRCCLVNSGPDTDVAAQTSERTMGGYSSRTSQEASRTAWMNLGPRGFSCYRCAPALLG